MYVVKYSIYQDQDMKISISALMKQMLLVFIQAFTSNHCWNTVVTYKDVQISHLKCERSDQALIEMIGMGQ